MEKIISKKDRKHFYGLSLYIVIAYIAMFIISLFVAIVNSFIASGKWTGTTWKWVALILSTLHSLLILINWFAIKLQKSRIEYVKDSKIAWLLSVLMDVLSTFGMVCNTVTSLINGGVLDTKVTWLLPMMSFITFGISIINFIFALYFWRTAKKSVKTNKTL